MEPNLHEYPYTSYEDGCNMGCFMGMCHRAGVKLAVVGDSLQLLDKNNFVLSQVKIAIAQSALKDELGNDITAYIINAGTREDTVVFSKGNGDEIVITVPYATEASKDSEGQDITSYLRNIVVSGDKLRVTKGDGSAFEITVPYATKAFTDVNDKPITTYAASMEVSGNNVILKDGLGTVISTITVHFAERAAADENGNNIRESYASVLQAGTTTVKLIAKSGDLLSEITVPYATSALKDTNGNEFLKDYAESLVVDNDGKRLDLLAHDGTLLSAVTVPFSTLATDATNAIERAEIVGDQLVLTTYGGVVTRLTIPYAVRALNDGESNEITKTYVHNVVQDPVTDEITFYDAEGTALCALTPRARIAEYDTYNNLIADYIKTLVFDNQSDYLVATHGDGTADTIVVNYATKAWKDTQGNIIKNTYIAFLTNVVDNEGEWVLVAYNGEGSELFRLKVVANKAQKDAAGNIITEFYVHSLTISGDTISYNDANDVVIGSITLPKYVAGMEWEYPSESFWYRTYDIDGNTLQRIKFPIQDWLRLGLVNSDQIQLQDFDNEELRIGRCTVHLPEYVKSAEVSGNNLLLKDIHGNTLNTLALPGSKKSVWITRDDSFCQYPQLIRIADTGNSSFKNRYVLSGCYNNNCLYDEEGYMLDGIMEQPSFTVSLPCTFSNGTMDATTPPNVFLSNITINLALLQNHQLANDAFWRNFGGGVVFGDTFSILRLIQPSTGAILMSTNIYMGGRGLSAVFTVMSGTFNTSDKNLIAEVQTRPFMRSWKNQIGINYEKQFDVLSVDRDSTGVYFDVINGSTINDVQLFVLTPDTYDTNAVNSINWTKTDVAQFTSLPFGGARVHLNGTTSIAQVPYRITFSGSNGEWCQHQSITPIQFWS